MRGIHPRRRLLLLAASSALCVAAYVAYYRPAIAAQALVQGTLRGAAVTAEAKAALDISYIAAAKRLEQSSAARDAWLARLWETPPLEEVYERFEASLHDRGCALQQFAPAPDVTPRIDAGELSFVEERFAASFQASYQDVAALFGAWQGLAGLLRFESISIVPSGADGCRVRVDLTCVLARKPAPSPAGSGERQR